MAAQPKKVFRVIIHAPIDKVWAELTRSDEVLPFFFNARIDTVTGLRKGKPFRMISPDGKYTSVVGEVLEFDPPRRYSHTMRFTNLDDPYATITYELKEVEEGTEFTLTNVEVPAGTKTEKYMTGGAQFIVDNLKAVIETGKPTFGGSSMLLMIKLTAPFSPKSTLTGNWPFDRISSEHRNQEGRRP